MCKFIMRRHTLPLMTAFGRYWPQNEAKMARNGFFKQHVKYWSEKKSSSTKIWEQLNCKIKSISFLYKFQKII